MALTYSEMIPLGSKAADFKLSGTRDGKTYSDFELKEYAGKKAVLIMFICNHCPYVKAINDRIADLAHKYSTQGVGIIAINSNDAIRYPEDSFEKMKEQHTQFKFNFPYLVDADQKVAKTYGAVCTPDFFLFDHEMKLRYRGRMDDNWKDPTQVKTHDLAEAIECLLMGKFPSEDQMPSMGCSIKWKQ